MIKYQSLAECCSNIRHVYKKWANNLSGCKSALIKNRVKTLEQMGFDFQPCRRGLYNTLGGNACSENVLDSEYSEY